MENTACLLCGERMGEFGPATVQYSASPRTRPGATHAGKCTILYLAFTGDLNMLREYCDLLIRHGLLEKVI